MFVSMVILRGLVRALEQAGVSCEQLAERCGICADRLVGEQQALSLAEWRALLTAAEELTQGGLLELSPSAEDMAVFSLVIDVAAGFHRGEWSGASIAPQLRSLLRAELDLQRTTLGSCAIKLGVRERALRRRLLKEGYRFSELLTQERCRIACEVLARREATVRDAALRSGYSDVSPFHRAFQRWMGQTPAAYRRTALRTTGLARAREQTVSRALEDQFPAL